MKKMLCRSSCFFLLLFSLHPAFSQTRTVKGKVSDEKDQPVANASVVVKGNTPVGTTTNQSGLFTLTVSGPADSLLISAIGYSEVTVPVTGEAINVRLALANARLDEVVVVGYGTQRKASLTASISTVKGEDMVRQPVSDLSNALGGRAAGVIFTQTSGQVGNDASSILIRGVATNGNSTPLFIVDGIPRNYSQLNPSDVESITVLKDAAAVAPYGLAGANGVILVTTKTGKAGKPVFSYDGY
ncbi:MAG TPA: TonB-dependent receptor plug domain-containing protein, partial [Puia sp.]|nr:TonB-dependent receptor plug domain-containing protein [Puia sp.]